MLLEYCTRVRNGEKEVVLDEGEKHKIQTRLKGLCRQGLRVLGLAYKNLTHPNGSTTTTTTSSSSSSSGGGDKVYTPEQLLGGTFVGMIAFEDPIRRGVEGAIHTCLRAGVRVIMVSGDHIITAAAVAEKVGEWWWW